MFDKLRWKLTAFNTAITGSILLCLVVLCLTLSEENIKNQTMGNFYGHLPCGFLLSGSAGSDLRYLDPADAE